MLQQHFGALLGATACVFLVLGIFISPAFAQRHRLNKVIRSVTERYNAELDRSRVERQSWNGERIVLTGIIRADTARVDALRDALREAALDLAVQKERNREAHAAFSWLDEFLKDLARGGGIHVNAAREIVKKHLGV